MPIRVGVVGYGTIGRRVADAVLRQEDMELVGITGNSFNYRVRTAAERNIPIYTIADQTPFREKGVEPAGTMDDLVKEVDVIVDTSPKPHGKENKEKYYIPNNVKAIFQGGEKAGVAQTSFVAQCNYKQALNKNYVRVVSCNTTGLCRSLGAIHENYGVKMARACMIRRAADPDDTKKGPINAIEPVLELPSHHGPDVQTVLPINITTTAVKIPTTLMHLHSVSVELEREATAEEVRALFEKTTRIRLVSGKEGIETTAQIMELAKDLGTRRGDMNEICIWEDGIGCIGSELFYFQAIHQESDVVPENIDAIRAVTGFEDSVASIQKTNLALGIK